MHFARLTTALSLVVLGAVAQPPSDNPLTGVAARGVGQTEATRITDNIYQAIGFGNTFLVTTPDGNVIIDTSSAGSAALHVKLLKAKSPAPVKYIILTHGHGDHTGGIALWKEAGTHVVAQKNHIEFVNYQARLNGFFALRNAAQFEGRAGPPTERPWPGNYGAKIWPDILFDDKYEFVLGGVRFELYSTPGETPDHLSVWIPQWKAAFTGDNYYESFPNIYTLRGTEPRWALDYVHSLDKVLSWKPELVLPSHGRVIETNSEVAKHLTRSRDAIQYVHDQVVQGMNAGKDVYALMRDIHLPDNLAVGESYGKVTWSIREIYEGYAGWFDLNPATMYPTPPTSAYADLVKLAGGPDAVLKIASERSSDGKLVEALRLIDATLAFDPSYRPALQMRLKTLGLLREKSDNSNEVGWLEYAIKETQEKLK
jgi:alkyl sulfatase BDS1-like metallo-beta-lactamase superfamily hydrolase